MRGFPDESRAIDVYWPTSPVLSTVSVIQSSEQACGAKNHKRITPNPKKKVNLGCQYFCFLVIEYPEFQLQSKREFVDTVKSNRPELPTMSGWCSCVCEENQQGEIFVVLQNPCIVFGGIADKNYELTFIWYTSVHYFALFTVGMCSRWMPENTLSQRIPKSESLACCHEDLKSTGNTVCNP